MKLKRFVFIAFFLLMIGGNAPAQLFGPPYAIGQFEKLSGLRIGPSTDFVLCVGTTENPLKCKPRFGEWDKVRNIPFVTFDFNKDTAELDKVVKEQITNKYLGAGFGNGRFDNSCIPAGSPTNVTLKSVLYDGPVRSTGISQLVAEEIVKAAMVKIKGIAEANKLGNKGTLSAAFETAIRREIRGESSNRADVKWVMVQLQADLPRLQSFPSTQGCIEFARQRNGSLVTGIAGFIIMSSAGSSKLCEHKQF